MATPLTKPLAREIVLGEQAYKVVMSPDGIRLTPKHGRRGTELTWDAILAFAERAGPPPNAPPAHASDVPRAVAADITSELRTAISALERARTELVKTGSLPSGLLAELDADPIYGRAEARTDWYVEPLLTPHEVASILRVSRARVAHLGIPSLMIQGERRYRQSELRRYLMNNEARY